MAPGSSKPQEKHKYLPLDSLKPNTKVDVYGVVKFVKQPSKSKGSDYFMMLSITDPSFDDAEQKLKCLIFGKDETRLPVASVGEIVRFHRLSVSQFRGELQGQSCPGLSWLIFSGDPTQPADPVKSSSPNYALTDSDRDKVVELRQWATGHGLSGRLCTFSGISVGDYFDCICQVVCTCVIEDGVCLLLRVWDGTQTSHNVRQLDTATETLNRDERLSCLAKPFLYDICVFDDHCTKAKDIKPGDYIKLCNLHAAEYKPTNQHVDLPSTSTTRDGPSTTIGEKQTSSKRDGPSSTRTKGDGPSPSLELVLHKGTAFGRCVTVLPADSSDVNMLKENLEKVTSTFAVFTDSEIMDINIMSDSQDVDIDYTPNSLIDTSGQMGDKYTDATVGKGSNQLQSVRKVITAPTFVRTTNKLTTNRQINNPETNKENLPGSSVPGGSNENHDPLLPVNASSSVTTPGSTNDGGEILGPKRTTTKRTLDSCSVADRELEKKRMRVGQPDVIVITDSEASQDNENIDTNNGSSGDMANPEPVVISSESGTATGGLEESKSANSGDARCMMETTTVIRNHPNIKATTIGDILKHSVPYKFRLRARVYDYHPKPDSVCSFLHMYCTECHYLCPMPNTEQNREAQESSQLSIGSTFRGVPHYNCPQCLANKDSLQGLESPPHLRYIFMMRFLLRDDTGWLMANIWKEEAERFFQEIQPEEVIQNKSLLIAIRQDLSRVCPSASDLADRPLMECCVKSYSVADGTGFQIFDTSIA